MHPVPPPTEGPLRSIAAPPPVKPRRLHDGDPILAPDPANGWERRVVLNPAVALVSGADLDRQLPAWGLPGAAAARLREAGGAAVMLYRAQGDVVEALRMAPSSLGRAFFTPDLQLVHRDAEPALTPDAPFHNLGLEDARATTVDGTHYLYYTGYFDPSPEDDYDRGVQVCLATSDDLQSWTLHGPVEGDINAVNNKNAVLLPEPVGGRWVLLHRPMEGAGAMAIHWATAPAPSGPWTSQGVLMRSFRYREFAQSWIGAGGPPVSLGDGRFLTIYHQGHYGRDGHREYDLAATLLDFSQSDPDAIVGPRIEPMMRPTGALEQVGDEDLGVDNVVFSCANYVWQDDLVIPYAGADSRIFGAAMPLQDLVDALEGAEGDDRIVL